MKLKHASVREVTVTESVRTVADTGRLAETPDPFVAVSVKEYEPAVVG
jgi:hypothetical protein